MKGFAADEVLYDITGGVRGVATKDAGISKNGVFIELKIQETSYIIFVYRMLFYSFSFQGEIKGTFTRGVELTAKQTLFAEGARGSCSKAVMEKFRLTEGKDVQTYGLGRHAPALSNHAF